ncbi:O-antigen ligase family protein [Geothermobacter ehrlichii]|uniref:O-antigen ligase family protein n=1 Tax=Geothermobacter ehrlichii TaxID=213224 RepID=UPI0016532299|nr:O-antigen ligase family protein [Geothermobacter ehrlichii]
MVFLKALLFNGNKVFISNNVKIFCIVFMYGTLASFVFIIFGKGRLDYALNSIVLIVFGFFIYIVMDNLRVTPELIKKLLLAYSVGTISSIIIFLLFDSKIYIPRFSGLYRNPNNLGLACAISIITIFHYLVRGGSRLLIKILLMPSVVLLFYALFASGSRSAMLALLIAFLCILRKHINCKKIILLATLVLLTIWSMPYLDTIIATDFDYIIGRYSQEALNSGSGRTDIWKNAVEVTLDHYFLGIGVGQYRAIHSLYIHKSKSEVYETILNHDLGTHSDFLDLLANYGVICLILYILFLGNNYKRLVDIVNNNKDGVLLLSIFVCIVFFGCFRESFSSPDYWFLLALTTCVSTYGFSSSSTPDFSL